MNQIKASRLETLGAWLGLWTPPRDVVVPPVPWRKVAYAALGLALLIAATAAFVAPAIDEAKDEGAAQRQAELDERQAERRARIERLQQPRFGTLTAAAAASARQPAAAITTIEQAIGEDARQRFSPNAKTATCEPSPGVDERANRVAYDCLTATSTIRGAADQEGAQGELGYPYRAVLDRDAGRYAFCRIFPLPGEQALADPRTQIQVPRECSINAG